MKTDRGPDRATGQVAPTPEPRRPAGRTVDMPKWVGVLLGGLVGLGLGLAIGYYASAPLFGGQGGNVVIPLGIGAVLVIGLVVRGLVKQSASPLLVAAAVIGAGVVGTQLAPGAPGSREVWPGTGAAATLEGAAALWSGSVRCEWLAGNARVDRVSAFEIPISDQAVRAARGLPPSARLVALQIGQRGGPSGMLDIAPEDLPMGAESGFLADLEDVAANASAGTAVSAEAGIVFRWACDKGP